MYEYILDTIPGIRQTIDNWYRRSKEWEKIKFIKLRWNRYCVNCFHPFYLDYHINKLNKVFNEEYKNEIS